MYRLDDDRKQTIADVLGMYDYSEVVDDIETVEEELMGKYKAAKRALDNLPLQVEKIKRFCNNPLVWEELEKNLIAEFKKGIAGKNLLRIISQNESVYFNQWLLIYDKTNTFHALVVEWNAGHNVRVKVEKKIKLMVKWLNDPNRVSPFLLWQADRMRDSLKSCFDLNAGDFIQGSTALIEEAMQQTLNLEPSGIYKQVGHKLTAKKIRGYENAPVVVGDNKGHTVVVKFKKRGEKRILNMMQ